MRVGGGPDAQRGPGVKRTASSRTSARPAPSRSTPPRPKFWQDPKLRQEIGITDAQSGQIESIFSSSIQALRDARKDLDALEAVLSRTIQENTADVFTVSQQVDKVEAARSAYNKLRTVMLYRMNLVLNPDQRIKVKAMNDRVRRAAPQGRRGAPQAGQAARRATLSTARLSESAVPHRTIWRLFVSKTASFWLVAAMTAAVASPAAAQDADRDKARGADCPGR